MSIVVYLCRSSACVDGYRFRCTQMDCNLSRNSRCQTAAPIMVGRLYDDLSHTTFNQSVVA